MNIFERIRKFNLPIGDYAVFGSALLDLWRIRRAQDLDIIVTPQLYEKLKQNGWEEKLANGFSILSKDDANVTTVQKRATDGDYFPDRIQLIKDAVFIKGLPFVRIEEVVACKKSYNRPKDVADIISIENYMKIRNKDEIYLID